MSIISKKTKRSFDVFLIIAAFLVVFPYIWMFFTSFKPVEEVFTDKLSILHGAHEIGQRGGFGRTAVREVPDS